MFVERKQSWMKRLRTSKFKYETSNIAFMCMKAIDGFEVGKTYKPFAYTAGFDTYTNFALFDRFGQVLFMEDVLIKKGYFKVLLHGNLFVNDFVENEEESIRLIEYENKFWKNAVMSVV